MSTDQQAATELLNMALQADKESTCNLLLDSAKRLNPDINTTEYKNTWLATWLASNKDRKKLEE